MNILVLGAGGMAGHVISLYLREHGYQVDTLSARKSLDTKTKLIDVTDKAKLIDALKSTDYDAVINCIGLLVKQSNAEQDTAAYINGYFPHLLETHYRTSHTKLIHLSTDCVFSGENPPYREDSPYSGQSFYDRSKALGEVINDKDLTLRMSIIGPDMRESGTGLFNWFYGQTGTISGYTKAFWSGITTVELARGISEAIKQNLSGLYHLVPHNNISKFELLQLFRATFERKDITIKPDSSLVVDKTLVNTRSDFDFTVSDYPVMIQEMKGWIDAHKALYAQYE